ncbi:MAG: hypothetical protein ACRDUV_16725 [Pseudonocardiaceae bacterium]
MTSTPRFSPPPSTSSHQTPDRTHNQHRQHRRTHRAVRVARNTTRFEPATLAVGGLALLALQTESRIDRNAAGEWQFRLHKKALRDSTLGRLLEQLLALYTNPPQK